MANHPVIVRVNPEDEKLLADVFAIAQAVALPVSLKEHFQNNGTSEAPGDLDLWQGKGFLISGYPQEKYRVWAGTEGGLYASLEDDRAVAFLTAYGRQDLLTQGDHESAFIRSTLAPDAVIIKQVGTHPAHQGKGHARALYHHFAQICGSDIYLVIELAPRNFASEEFHRKMGYEQTALFRHPSGKMQAIWKKPKS